MVLLALSAALPVLLLGLLATPDVLQIAPEGLALVVLLTGYGWGLRGVAVVLPACWFLLAGGWQHELRLARQISGGDFAVTGTVCDVPRERAGVQRFVLRLDDHSVAAGLPRRVFLSWYDAGRQVRAGETWRFMARLKRPRGVSNPAGFDAERWAFLNDLGATGYVRKAALNRRLSSQARHCRLPAVRQQLAEQILATLPDARAARFLPALAVGVRDALEPGDWRVLQRTGTTHLMAISGLHIGLAAGFAWLLSSWISRCLILFGCNVRVGRLAQAAALAGAFCYSLMAGFALPTVRAFVMTASVILFSLMVRKIAARNALAIALYAILWLEPFALLTNSFWLSFGAVCVLLMAGFGLGRRNRQLAAAEQSRLQRAGSRLRQLCRAQLCLAAGLLPMMTQFFGLLPVFAPLINFIVVPLFGFFIIPLLLTGVIALALIPVLSQWLLAGADRLLVLVLAVLQWLDSQVPLAFELLPFSGPALAGLLLLPILLIWPSPLPGRWVALLLTVSLMLTGTGWSRWQQPDLRVVVIDVGQGLSVLIQLPGYAALYDTGPRYRKGNAGESVVVPVLRSLGVGRLDTLIVSHGDADHAGGVPGVLHAYPHASVLASDPAGIEHHATERCRAGQRWQVGDTEFAIVHPDPAERTTKSSDNDASCVLIIRHGQATIVLPGDIGKRVERRLAAQDIVSASTLVLAAHHGSLTSSTQLFTAATRPAYVVFTVAHRNRWGFPRPEVVARWRQTGACLLRSDRDGALIFAMRGDSLRLVRRWRADHARLWSERSGPACTGQTTVN